jgi:hypothetical protein
MVDGTAFVKHEFDEAISIQQALVAATREGQEGRGGAGDGQLDAEDTSKGAGTASGRE